MSELELRVLAFTGDAECKECKCDHKLDDTEAVFYQSVKLIQCIKCLGWQKIRKPIK